MSTHPTPARHRRGAPAGISSAATGPNLPVCPEEGRDR